VSWRADPNKTFLLGIAMGALIPTFVVLMVVIFS
jgi:hypothetical protein